MLSFNKKFLVFPLMICLMLVTLCTFGFAGCSTDKITVTFEANGGYFEIEGETETKSSYTLEVNKGEKLDLSKLYLPKRDSTNTKVYTFDGWDVDVSQTVSENLTVKASWKEETRMYTITFDANGGVYTHLSTPTTTVSSDYEYDASISVPATPTRAADNSYTYTFMGYDATVNSKATQSITYKAQWEQTPILYTVTFNANGGSIDVGSGETKDSYQNDGLKYGDKIELPTGYSMVAPESTAAQVFEFDGWYDAASGGNKIANVSGNTTVYAHWTAKDRLYDITFNAGAGKFKNGSSTNVVKMKYGATISYPYVANDAPVMDMTNTTIYTFKKFNIPEGATVSGDIEFKAEYTQTTRMYTVTFDAGEGYFSNTAEKTLTRQFEWEAEIIAPEMKPTRQATVDKVYTFTGYEGLTSESKVSGDGIVFHAQYGEAVRQYAVTFYAGENAYFVTGNGSKTYQEVLFDYGAIVVAPEIIPTKSPTDAFTYEFDKYRNLTDSTRVTGSGMAFTAEYVETDRYYTITFDAGDGYFVVEGENGSQHVQTVTQQVKYNDKPSVESVATPVRNGDSYASYTFSTWGALSIVTADATYTAQYTAEVNTYTVAFFKEQGDLNPIYTAKFAAAPNAAPVLSAEQMKELEAACETANIKLVDENGFAGKWCFMLRNASESFNITGDNGVYKFGNGKEANPYLINSLTGFEGMMSKLEAYYTTYAATDDAATKSAVISEASDVYYKLIADIDFADYNGGSCSWFIGHLDAKKSATENYSIKGLNPDKFISTDGAIFEYMLNAEVSNLDILLGDYIASFAGVATGEYAAFNNVNIRNAGNSTMVTSSDNNESAYLAHSNAGLLSFVDCTNYANYVSEASYFGLFLGGYTYSNPNNFDSQLVFRNCVNYGNVVSSDKVGMLTGNPWYRNFSEDTVVVEGCVNYGKIAGLGADGFVGFYNNKADGVSESLKNTLSAKITNAQGGEFVSLPVINASLDSMENFALTAKGDTVLAAGKYVLTVVAYARGEDKSTVRVNYSTSKTLNESAQELDFDLMRYDFIDLTTYEASYTSAFDENDWAELVGYNIRYAFDNTNRFVVFDFANYTKPMTLTGSSNSTAYITYYNEQGELASSANFAVAAYTRAN